MTAPTIDLQEIKFKLYERLKPSGWADILKTFLLSREMDIILQQLLAESSTGNRFTPGLKQVFRAFEECPWHNVRIVFISNDPYPQPGVADGLALSCGNTGKIEPALKFVFENIREEIYPTIMPGKYQPDPDLKRWSQQGILLLNMALTTRVGQVGVHYNLWHSFIAFVLSRISTAVFAGVIFVFMGRKSEVFTDLIDTSNHFKILVSHPTSARYGNKNRWDAGSLFKEINRLIDLFEETRIIW